MTVGPRREILGLGSTRVSRVGFGVTPKQSSLEFLNLPRLPP
jgi:hypothetical protein